MADFVSRPSNQYVIHKNPEAKPRGFCRNSSRILKISLDARSDKIFEEAVRVVP